MDKQIEFPFLLGPVLEEPERYSDLKLERIIAFHEKKTRREHCHKYDAQVKIKRQIGKRTKMPLRFPPHMVDSTSSSRVNIY
ncbi:hypothetical protein HOD29_05125 [archaeon]|jgi:hypothetical protein|nr:hypothetical protein [archaeon]